MKTLDFDQNEDEPCVYKKTQRSMMVFLVLYVDDILLIRNALKLLSSTKIWISTQFQMKYLDKTQYSHRIKVLWGCKNRKTTLSQATYIDKLLVKDMMQNSKKGLLPFRHGVSLSRDRCIRQLRRKIAQKQYTMLQHWVALYMWYFVLDQTFASS